MQGQKIMTKIMKTTISLGGVDSISVDSKENKVVVIGDGIDAIDLVTKLREFCDAELISMGPARNEKKIEPNNDHAIQYQNALAELTKSYQANPDRYFGARTAEDDRKACAIM
ncbi:hypothetical protein SADUNF_Sadunf17G0131500 [Salix dunnii]|uniref:Uncharacterized protein n=1 Tax=Salix dunnii TaxID=1413687 RepID=A0A835J719_9ROSI|nr:hypothetical protein SADUNF_Sadunf17G0131500 [Salix dunnii]